MRLPFDFYYKITNEFGEHPELYKQFNVQFPDGTWHPMKGHNGIDFATPFGTELKAPISGNIIEASYDENGYGWYVKIENDKEGVVLGHFSKLAVQVGFHVNEGDPLGLSGNSGNVFPKPTETNPQAGSHTHFAKYTKPRNRANGYGGYEDPRPELEALGLIEPLVKPTSVTQPLPSPIIGQNEQPAQQSKQAESAIFKSGVGDSGNSKEIGPDWFEFEGQRTDLNNKETFKETYKLWKKVVVDHAYVTKEELNNAILKTKEEALSSVPSPEPFILEETPEYKELDKKYQLALKGWQDDKDKLKALETAPKPEPVVVTAPGYLSEEEAEALRGLLKEAQGTIGDLITKNNDLNKVVKSLSTLWNKQSKQNLNVGEVALKYMDKWMEEHSKNLNRKTLGLYGLAKKAFLLFEQLFPAKEQGTVTTDSGIVMKADPVATTSMSDFIFEQLGLLTKS